MLGIALQSLIFFRQASGGDGIPVQLLQTPDNGDVSTMWSNTHLLKYYC